MLIDFRSNVEILTMQKRVYTDENETHTLYIGDSNEKNYKYFPDMIDLWGNREVRHIKVRGNYIEIYIYVEGD